MAFRTGITFDSEDYYPMLVANAMLGSAPNNLLFEKLREQESLCYYVRSAFVSFNGEIYIYSGLSDHNVHKASELIFQEIEDLKEGIFDAELLINTKKVLVNDLHESLDSQNTIAGRVYLYNQVGKVFDLAEVERQVKNVRKEDIIRAAKTIELEMKYALTNKEDVWKK
jgi:predicted Zn-dependent peptidase